MYASLRLAVAAAVICGAAAFVLFHETRDQTALAAAEAPSTAPYTPAYTKDGDFVPPLQYREWVYLTSGFDMSYAAKSNADMHMFDNVFVNPEAYRSFLETGTWPDKTVMVLESREAANKGSINQAGHFQRGGLMGLEFHVKDEKRFAGKWAFFDAQSESKATLFPATANCYSCHQEHAAVDTTFVQFYPTLLPVAEKNGTLSANYRKETAEQKPETKP